MSRASRVAVLSDVHGNAVALEAVLGEVRAEAPELVVFGGDLSWGPLPRETLALVRGLAIPARFVRGNAEGALFDHSEEPSERKRWLLERHGSADLELLRVFEEQFVVEVDGLGPVRFCHGSPRSDIELVTPETPDERVREWSTGINEPVVVSAHTHVQFDRSVAGVRSVNPGSVGMAYEPMPGAYWAMLGPDVELRRTAYPLDRAVAAYEASGDPATREMIEILREPPTRAEVIEHAERHVFSS